MNSSVITAITDHIFCHVWNLTGFRKLALITSSQVEEISAIGISRRVCEGQGCPGMHYLHTRCATLVAKCSNDSEWQKTSGLSLSYTLITLTTSTDSHKRRSDTVTFVDVFEVLVVRCSSASWPRRRPQCRCRRKCRAATRWKFVNLCQTSSSLAGSCSDSVRISNVPTL